jgi:hypothetical protein
MAVLGSVGCVIAESCIPGILMCKLPPVEKSDLQAEELMTLRVMSTHVGPSSGSIP